MKKDVVKKSRGILQMVSIGFLAFSFSAFAESSERHSEAGGGEPSACLEIPWSEVETARAEIERAWPEIEMRWSEIETTWSEIETSWLGGESAWSESGDGALGIEASRAQWTSTSSSTDPETDEEPDIILFQVFRVSGWESDPRGAAMLSVCR